MLDRDPITTWVHGRIALLGDAAHPPLQYLAQGAIMAIEDGWVLAQHIARLKTATVGAPGTVGGPATVGVPATVGIPGTVGAPGTDWDAALAAYEAVRVEHCRRVVLTARKWGELWHLDGTKRVRRNALLCARDTYDYGFTDWIYGPTALTPDQEPALYSAIPLDSGRRAGAVRVS